MVNEPVEETIRRWEADGKLTEGAALANAKLSDAPKVRGWSLFLNAWAAAWTPIKAVLRDVESLSLEERVAALTRLEHDIHEDKICAEDELHSRTM